MIQHEVASQSPQKQQSSCLNNSGISPNFPGAVSVAPSSTKKALKKNTSAGTRHGEVRI
jgi:hypothetical protein